MSELTTTMYDPIENQLHDVSIPEAVGRDELFGVLADERRRHVLAVLHDENLPAGVSTIADAVAGRRPPSDGRVDPEEVAVRLVHVHLPKLDDAGLIEYDRDRRVVTDATRVDESLLP